MSSNSGSYVVVLILSIAALLASTRLSPASRRLPNDPRRLLSLTVAILTGLLVLVSPLDALADKFFSTHMIEHELLLFTMPIALLAARPIPVALVAPWRLLPSRWRRSFGRSWNWTRGSLAGFQYLERPIVAFVLSTVMLWLWHVPTLYDTALRSEWVHTLEHVSFLATSLLYWRPLLSGRHSGVLDSNAKRVLYLLAGGMQGGLLGALIALDNNVLYPGYLREPGASLESVLADQHLGGAIMWFTGPVFCAVVAALVLDNGDIGSRGKMARSPDVDPVLGTADPNAGFSFDPSSRHDPVLKAIEPACER